MEDVSDFSARKLMERNIMKKIILDLDTGIDDTWHCHTSLDPKTRN